MNMEVAQCPWREGRLLLRVGLKGKEVELETKPASRVVAVMRLERDVRRVRNGEEPLGGHAEEAVDVVGELLRVDHHEVHPAHNVLARRGR